jgi:hypothetical protein
MGLKGLRAVLITYMEIREPESSPESKRKNAFQQVRRLMGVSASVPRLGISNSLSSLNGHLRSVSVNAKAINIE